MFGKIIHKTFSVSRDFHVTFHEIFHIIFYETNAYTSYDFHTIFCKVVAAYSHDLDLQPWPRPTAMTSTYSHDLDLQPWPLPTAMTSTYSHDLDLQPWPRPTAMTSTYYSYTSLCYVSQFWLSFLQIRYLIISSCSTLNLHVGRERSTEHRRSVSSIIKIRIQ